MKRTSFCRAAGGPLGVGFWLGALWVVLIGVLALLAPWLPLPEPDAMDLLNPAAPPGPAAWLGTDGLGRDLLSRVVHGARVSLLVGLIAPVVGLAVGGALGLAAGYFRGRTDALISVLVDAWLAFPGLVLALAVMGFLGRDPANLVLVLGLLSVPAFARLVRAHTLALSRRDFVVAAAALGAGPLRILRTGILPSLISTLSAFALTVVAVVTVAEGTLSFLGLGAPPPTPSWGGMIAEGREYLEEAPHVCLVPAVVLFFTVLSFNLMGEALRGRSGRGS